MKQIPVPTKTPAFTLRAELEGTVYLIRVEWQARSGWYLGLSSASGVGLMSLRRAVVDWNLLAKQTDPALPPGGLFLSDSTGLHGDAGYGDMGVRHGLFYLTKAEVSALGA